MWRVRGSHFIMAAGPPLSISSRTGFKVGSSRTWAIRCSSCSLWAGLVRFDSIPDIAGSCNSSQQYYLKSWWKYFQPTKDLKHLLSSTLSSLLPLAHKELTIWQLTFAELLNSDAPNKWAITKWIHDKATKKQSGNSGLCMWANSWPLLHSQIERARQGSLPAWGHSPNVQP